MTLLFEHIGKSYLVDSSLEPTAILGVTFRITYNLVLHAMS